MTDLITRPAPAEQTLAERLLTTQAPQRPQSTPVIRVEVDGKLVEGRAGQTILEVCRDNGIETRAFCMIGFPEETPAMVEETFELVERFDPDQVQFCAVTAYPHTMRSTWQTTRLTVYRPPIACQRASRSEPTPRSNAGIRAMRRRTMPIV